jgi:anti-repressor protein
MNVITITATPIGGSTVDTVDARELHGFLEVAKDFSDWFRAQVERARLRPGRDFVEVSPQQGENPRGGRPRTDYALTVDAAKHVAMMSGTERGFEAREYFLECERRAKAPKVDPASLSRRDLLKLALQAEEELAEARATVAVLQPKAAALDRIATARGSLCITDAAKHLGVPARSLFDWLKANGWTFRRHGARDWLGYGHREQAGQLEHKTVTLQRTGINGEPIDRIATQVRITPKGLTAIAQQMPGAREPATTMEHAA